MTSHHESTSLPSSLLLLPTSSPSSISKSTSHTTNCRSNCGSGIHKHFGNAAAPVVSEETKKCLSFSRKEFDMNMTLLGKCNEKKESAFNDENSVDGSRSNLASRCDIQDASTRIREKEGRGDGSHVKNFEVKLDLEKIDFCKHENDEALKRGDRSKSKMSSLPSSSSKKMPGKKYDDSIIPGCSNSIQMSGHTDSSQKHANQHTKNPSTVNTDVSSNCKTTTCSESGRTLVLDSLPAILDTRHDGRIASLECKRKIQTIHSLIPQRIVASDFNGGNKSDGEINKDDQYNPPRKQFCFSLPVDCGYDDESSSSSSLSSMLEVEEKLPYHDKGSKEDGSSQNERYFDHHNKEILLHYADDSNERRISRNNMNKYLSQSSAVSSEKNPAPACRKMIQISSSTSNAKKMTNSARSTIAAANSERCPTNLSTLHDENYPSDDIKKDRYYYDDDDDDDDEDEMLNTPVFAVRVKSRPCFEKDRITGSSDMVDKKSMPMSSLRSSAWLDDMNDDLIVVDDNDNGKFEWQQQQEMRLCSESEKCPTIGREFRSDGTIINNNNGDNIIPSFFKRSKKKNLSLGEKQSVKGGGKEQKNECNDDIRRSKSCRGQGGKASPGLVDLCFDDSEDDFDLLSQCSKNCDLSNSSSSSDDIICSIRKLARKKGERIICDDSDDYVDYSDSNSTTTSSSRQQPVELSGSEAVLKNLNDIDGIESPRMQLSKMKGAMALERQRVIGNKEEHSTTTNPIRYHEGLRKLPPSPNFNSMSRIFCKKREYIQYTRTTIDFDEDVGFNEENETKKRINTFNKDDITEFSESDHDTKNDELYLVNPPKNQMSYDNYSSKSRRKTRSLSKYQVMRQEQQPGRNSEVFDESSFSEENETVVASTTSQSKPSMTKKTGESTSFKSQTYLPSTKRNNSGVIILSPSSINGDPLHQWPSDKTERRKRLRESTILDSTHATCPRIQSYKKAGDGKNVQHLGDPESTCDLIWDVDKIGRTESSASCTIVDVKDSPNDQEEKTKGTRSLPQTSYASFHTKCTKHSVCADPIMNTERSMNGTNYTSFATMSRRNDLIGGSGLGLDGFTIHSCTGKKQSVDKNTLRAGLTLPSVQSSSRSDSIVGKKELSGKGTSSKKRGGYKKYYRKKKSSTSRRVSRGRRKKGKGANSKTTYNRKRNSSNPLSLRERNKSTYNRASPRGEEPYMQITRQDPQLENVGGATITFE